MAKLEPISEISPQELLASQEMAAISVPAMPTTTKVPIPIDLPLEESADLESRTMPAVERPQFDDRAPAAKGPRSRAIPHARTVRMRPTPTPIRSGVAGRAPRRRDLTRREEPGMSAVHADSTAIDMPAVNGSVLTDIPVLADDDTVVFESPAQYLLQHRTNIAHGAIVVRSSPIPIGTEKTLHLSVPGIDELYTLHARVILSTDDSIGLSIDEFDDHREALQALAE